MLFMPKVVFYIHLSNFNEKNPPLRKTKSELAENGYYSFIPLKKITNILNQDVQRKKKNKKTNFTFFNRILDEKTILKRNSKEIYINYDF